MFVLFFTAMTAFAQNITVTGSVKDAGGYPIIGAGVMQQGTSNGAATDFDGLFQLSVPANATLVFSSVGYIEQTIAVDGKTKIDVILMEDTELLEEVVVVGYGVQKKKLVTGATINVDGDAIQKQNTTNALGALYSSVPGVTITQANGQPWSGYNITIRGLSTTGDSRPLYVIDGIAGGDISSINPADIESIDILKDAASAAIYGARAAGGVVLVTTRQGQKGNVTVNYDGYYSFQKANFNGVSTVSASEYLDLTDRAYRSLGSLGENEHYYDLDALMPVQKQWIEKGLWDGTNWLEESVNRDAVNYNNAITINGGNDLIRFSGGFTSSHTDGLLAYPKKTYYDRNTLRINSDVTLWKKNGRDILKLGENATFSIYSSNGVQTAGIYNSEVHSYLTFTPLLPAYDLDGSLYTFEKQQRDNWMAVQGAANRLESNDLSKTESKNYRLQSNIFVEFAPHKDWKFKSVYGYSLRTSFSRSYTPSYILSSTSSQDNDSVSQSGSLGTNWTWENTLSWTHEFGDHHVDALFGQSLEAEGIGLSLNGSRKMTKFGSWEAASLSNCESDIDAKNVSVGGSNTVPYYKIASLFARANYNYNEKYMATVILRRDGSSNFASGHRFGLFPSVSAGWNITNEPWMSGTKSWLDHLKLRASWGQNGNCNITPFQYVASIALSAPYDVTASGTSVSTGAYPDIIPNENLTWEKTEQTDIGIDARFLGGRLATVFDVYVKDTKDWLVDAPALASYGTGAPTINGGAVRNKGVEFSFNWNDHVGDFFYGVSANISHNNNEVLYINNADGIIHAALNYTISQNIAKYNTYEARPGKPIGYFCGIKSEGIFQNQAQIDEYNAKGYTFIDGYEKAQPGDVIWVEQYKDGQYNEKDIVEIGNPHPDYNLGFTLNFEYKGLDFSVNGSGAFGQQILSCYRGNGETENYTNNFVNRLWTGEGSTNSFPRFSSMTHNNFMCNGYTGDIWIQNGDYVKLRTITLGYDLKKLIKALPVRSFRVYFTGQNLFTFTKYDGMDPEVSWGGEDSWSSGIDIGYYPSAKSYMFGVSLKF